MVVRALSLLRGLEPIRGLSLDAVRLALVGLLFVLMMICIGRLKACVKLRLCRLRVGMVTTVLALQLVRMQLSVYIGSCLLPIGPIVQWRRKMFAPG